MLENGKISSGQMAVVLYTAILTTAMLTVPSITSELAGRDLWLSPIWALPTGAISILLAYYLNKLYPGKTFVEYSQEIVGSFGGKLLSVIFIMCVVFDTSIILQEYNLFVSDNFYTSTPVVLIIAFLCFVCALNVRGGIEVIARSAQIFTPILFVLYFAIIVFLIPSLHLKNALPIMEHGLRPSLVASIIPQGWFSQFFVASFLFPYLRDKQNALKMLMTSLCLIVITISVSLIAIVSLFGELTRSLAYPIMMASRYVSLAEFFEHLESIAMTVWVTGAFVQVSLFYYVSILGIAQLFKLSDYRPLVFSFGLFLVYLTQWTAPSDRQVHVLISSSLPFLFIIVFTVLPFVLLAIALVRKRKRGSH